jgi:hypothetical protein
LSQGIHIRLFQKSDSDKVMEFISDIIVNEFKFKLEFDTLDSDILQHRCEVKSIKENDDPNNSGYKYKVEFKDYRDKSEGVDRTIKTKLVVIAAGTLGSTELLLRCKKSQTLKLSDKVGNHFSTNADILGVTPL